MKLRLYNTLSRKKETFEPLKDKKVGMYSCGPTVYWYQHIGNLRTYVFSDILKRVLKYNGYKAKHVMNVTDVGQLTSDADTGEDKMEKAAAKEGKKAEEIADYYWQIFRGDFKKLNISEPDIWCKATEHIKEQIEMVKILEEKGFVYKTSDGIYFDTSKLDDYGKLARLKIDDLRAGARVELGEKKNKTDFALWKFSPPAGGKEKRQQEWDSPWAPPGRDKAMGFPGWHIECSAMSSKYLGGQFDIHTGGEDHIPVHHTNEIAQSEAAFGKKPWVKYWLHGAFLKYQGEKVSKSKGGLYTVSELEKLGYSPLSYRYFCLTVSYRIPLNFSLEGMDSAKASYEKLKNRIKEIKTENKKSGNPSLAADYLKKFEKAVDDDLNMPQALAVLWETARDKKISGEEALNLIAKMDKVFGLDLLKEEMIAVPEEIKKMAEERETARKNKDWTRADELRKQVEEKGFEIEDKPEGFEIKIRG